MLICSCHQTDFSYYTTHKFHSSKQIQSSLCEKSFSTLHFNISSLSANYEAFAEMLSDMNHSFPIIGLSETKIKAGVAQYVNIDLPGYEFLSQPTFSNAGGCVLYS